MEIFRSSLACILLSPRGPDSTGSETVPVNAIMQRIMKPAAASVLALVALNSLAAEPRYDHLVRLTPENSAIGNFPAQKRPILTIKSGQTVKLETGGGNRWGEQDPHQW